MEVTFLVLLFLTTLVGLVNAQLTDQLDCTFDSGNFCNWANAVNGVEDDFDWQIGNQVQIDGFHSIPRTLTGTGFFAYVQGQFRPQATAAARAWLRSPVIDSLSQPATLSFNYWKAAVPPVLQVCTRNTGESQLVCIDTISGLGQQAWVRRVVTIPPNPVPFQIIFVASNFNTALDTIGIDDITFRRNALDETALNLAFNEDDVPAFVSLTIPHDLGAQDQTISRGLYPGSTGYASYPFSGADYLGGIPSGTIVYGTVAPPPPYFTFTPRARFRPTESNDDPASPVTPSLPFAADEGTVRGGCMAVACDFDHDLCDYYNDFRANFDWRIRNSGTGTALSGIPGLLGHASYVFVGGDGRKPTQRATLSSGLFVIPKGAYLEFYCYFSDTNTGQLSLYRNDAANPRNILWQNLGNKNIGAGWQKVTVPLQATNIPLTLIFLADLMSSGAFVGLDNIQLVDRSGNGIGCDGGLFVTQNVENGSNFSTVPSQQNQSVPLPTAAGQTAFLQNDVIFSEVANSSALLPQQNFQNQVVANREPPNFPTQTQQHFDADVQSIILRRRNLEYQQALALQQQQQQQQLSQLLLSPTFQFLEKHPEMLGLLTQWPTFPYYRIHPNGGGYLQFPEAKWGGKRRK